MALLGKWNWWAPGPLRRLQAQAAGAPPGHGQPALRNTESVLETIPIPSTKKHLPVVTINASKRFSALPDEETLEQSFVRLEDGLSVKVVESDDAC